MADAAGHMERLVDPQGTLDAAGAAQAPGWVALPASLGQGFTPATIWLRLRLQVDEMAPGGWMLQLSNALLDDVRVYMGRDETWTLLGHSGEDVSRSRWPVEYRSPVIPFEPPGPGVYTVMLRLQSKNALATRLEVWERLAFDNRSRREGLLFGLYFGFYLLLIGLHALFWRATRAPMSGLFLAYIGNCVMNEVLSLGLVQQLTGLPVDWSDRWLGVGIAVSLPVALRMSLKQLEVETTRAARWLQAASWLAAAVCAALVMLGRYGQGMAPIQMLALLCIVGL
ncbi:histidine kinase, partial [Bordetella hinzii]|nr:histidine kinase [Bordetella hinzii]